MFGKIHDKRYEYMVTDMAADMAMDMVRNMARDMVRDTVTDMIAGNTVSVGVKRQKPKSINTTGSDEQLCARRLDKNTIVLADELAKTKELGRKLSREQQLVCASCGSPLVFRCGDVLRPHFAHLPGEERWRHEPESPEHIAGKEALKLWLQQLLSTESVANIDCERKLPSAQRIADVFLTMQSGYQLALEYQRAALAPRELLRRTTAYRQSGVDVLWVWGENFLRILDNHNCRIPATIVAAACYADQPVAFLDPTPPATVWLAYLPPSLFHRRNNIQLRAHKAALQMGTLANLGLDLPVGRSSLFFWTAERSNAATGHQRS